jgi:hypothetical protein
LSKFDDRPDSSGVEVVDIDEFNQTAPNVEEEVHIQKRVFNNPDAE